MKTLILMVFAGLLVTPQIGNAAQSNTIVITNNENLDGTRKTIAKLEMKGFEVRHVLSQNVILGLNHQPHDNNLNSESNVRSIIPLSRFNEKELIVSDQFNKRLLSCCKIFADKVKDKNIQAINELPPPIMIPDIQTHLKDFSYSNSTILTADNALQATSSYMIGRAVVTLILMKSDVL